MNHLKQNLTINSLNDAYKLHDLAVKVRIDNNFVFHPHYRGEKDYIWEISSTFRRNVVNKTEKELADNFINMNSMSRFNNSDTKYEKYWNALIHLQHNGGPTDLIDWSIHIDTALYFASEDETVDGKIWVFMLADEMLYNTDSLYREDTISQFDPFNIKKSIMINPSYDIDLSTKNENEIRLMHQKGRLFKIATNEQSNYFKNLVDNEILYKFKIPKESKACIRQELNEVGVNKDYFNLS